MTDNMRYYETFYAIHVNHWTESFGAITDSNKLLVKDYISDGCTSTDTSSGTNTHKFLYPQHIAKVYFIEGVIEGQVTFAASTATAYICSYRVTVCKMHEDTTDLELFTTGWITVSDTLIWNTKRSIGEERVYPFWIDAWDKEKLDEHERIYLKVESTCSDVIGCVDSIASACTNIALWHSNDATWEDIKITIPFVGL